MDKPLTQRYQTHGGLDRQMLQSQREATGSYYTPLEIAWEVVLVAAARRLSVLNGWPCHEIISCLEDPSIEVDKARVCLESMMNWHVVDPAGGDGVFAVAWLSLLEHLVQALQPEKVFVADAAKRVHLFDLQRAPLERYVVMTSRHFGLEPEVLPVYCGNVLDLDALRTWMPLAQVMDHGGYDLVLGNPPYIGEKNHKAIFDEARSFSFGAAHYEKNMDYFYYFIHLGLELLTQGGVLGFVTTGYFLTADGASNLRRRMADMGSFVEMARFSGGSLFKDAAGQSNVIFHYIKGVSTDCRYAEVPEKPARQTAAWRWRHNSQVVCLNPFQIVSRFGNFHFSLHPGEPDAIEDIEACCGHTLDQFLTVRQGIVSGYDRTSDEGVFVLTPHEAERFGEEQSMMVPFYKNSQVRRGIVENEARYRMIYIPGEVEGFDVRYPKIFAHLSRHREKLSKRREVENGVRPWYALQWPRTPDLFEGPKIVAPHRALENAFAFSDRPLYGSADLYYLTLKDSEKIAAEGRVSRLPRATADQLSWDLSPPALESEMQTKARQRSAENGSRALTSEDLALISLLLTTDLYAFWLSLRGKRKGHVLELYATPLRQMPMIAPDPADAGYRALREQAWSCFQQNGHLADEKLRLEATKWLYQKLGLSASTLTTIEDFFKEKRRT